jgi:hypothetical protein
VVEQQYAVVGVLEDMNSTLLAFEKYIPKFFRGALQLYWGKCSIDFVCTQVLVTYSPISPVTTEMIITFIPIIITIVSNISIRRLSILKHAM